MRDLQLERQPRSASSSGTEPAKDKDVASRRAAPANAEAAAGDAAAAGGADLAMDAWVADEGLMSAMGLGEG
ncbi:MAG TPA: hypothetical protein PKU97_03935, partial [Kofleriaceae bacterium]|nr:hypothetical protein [Kofleriaceae bacterium]